VHNEKMIHFILTKLFKKSKCEMLLVGTFGSDENGFFERYECQCGKKYRIEGIEK